VEIKGTAISPRQNISLGLEILFPGLFGSNTKENDESKWLVTYCDIIL